MDEERQVRPKLEPSYGFSENVLASVAEAVNKIKNALQENQQKGNRSVTDAAFSARLERAMEKNFDYIRRKDQGLLSSGPKTGSQNSRGGSSAYSYKAPTRLGIGSTLAPVPPAPTSAAHSASTATAAASKNNNGNAPQESTSVYVSKLPTDISEEELEILFGALGRIKKVKIYTTALGKQKGDALVTFVLAETAITACFKFNNLDIGDGHVISVVRAEFNSSTTLINGNKVTGAITTATGNIIMDAEQPMLGSSVTFTNQSQTAVDKSEQGFHSHFVHSTSTHNDIGSRTQPSTTLTSTANSTTNSTFDVTSTNNILYTLLPVETEVGKYPVVLILNAFDPANAHDDDPSFFDELETDMLLECCGFGKVRTIQLLTLPPHYLTAVATISNSNTGSNGNAAISLQGVLGGAIGVTFELGKDAENCALSLRDRRFDGRVLKTFVLAPRTAVNTQVSTVENTANSTSNVPPPPPPPPRPPNVPKPADTTIAVAVSSITGGLSEEPAGPDIEAISNDVDDFLSSLL